LGIIFAVKKMILSGRGGQIMAERIFRTENDYTITAMRLILGIVFFAHGAQKALGWFDGPGLDGTVALFSNMGSV
jgi:uncharacterized membrane protein YphA (DoxX/SURF4 family)